MRIAVSYEEEKIYAHVGDTKVFKVYEIENGKVINSQLLDTDGKGRKMVVDFLALHKIDVLICQEICSGAKAAAEEIGTKVFGGVKGNSDEAVYAYLKGQLADGATVECHHS